MNDELTIEDVIGEVIIDHVAESMEFGELTQDEIDDILAGDDYEE